MRVTFRLNDTIQVFRFGSTANEKIAENKEKIVQTYTFSVDQYNYVLSCNTINGKADFKTFFSLDAKNCFDCPFSSNSGNGKCYTHKVMQYTGFIAMLKSIGNEFGSIDNIPEYNINLFEKFLKVAENKYVRFGTYGEPSLHPIELIESLANVSKNWTGYTHQWHRQPIFAQWFMASVHSPIQAKTANQRFNYRSFVASKDNVQNMVTCPASKEAGYKSNCSKCGLCSGTMGKGKKDVVILQH